MDVNKVRGNESQPQLLRAESFAFSEDLGSISQFLQHPTVRSSSELEACATPRFDVEDKRKPESDPTTSTSKITRPNDSRDRPLPDVKKH